MKEIDLKFSSILKDFLMENPIGPKKANLWTELCLYVSKALGDVDIKSYKSVIKLTKE